MTNLKVHKLESLCTQIWPQYKLDNQNRWPEFRTSDFNILSDLTNLLKWNGKWLEVTYIQAFWELRSPLSLCKCLGKHTDRNRPPWPGTVVTICTSCFTTGGHGKGHGTNKPPPTGKVQKRSKGDTTCPTTSQNPPRWHPSWLSNVCATRKDPESERLTKDNLEINPITIKQNKPTKNTAPPFQVFAAARQNRGNYTLS